MSESYTVEEIKAMDADAEDIAARMAVVYKDDVHKAAMVLASALGRTVGAVKDKHPTPTGQPCPGCLTSRVIRTHEQVMRSAIIVAYGAD